MSTSRVVGFDLDMTLIDSRRAILGSFAAVGAEKGVAIDPAGVDRRLGIKLEDELIHWFGPADIPAAVASYRRHYAELAGERTLIMPGAREEIWREYVSEALPGVLGNSDRGFLAILCEETFDARRVWDGQKAAQPQSEVDENSPEALHPTRVLNCAP